ncbi:acyltransferase [Terrisporobacter sp.]
MIKTYIIVFLNYIRFNIKKIKKDIDYKPIQTISLKTRMKLSYGGRLYLGHNTCISKYGDIFIGKKGDLYIGDRVYFNRGAFISCQNKVHIEKNCQFGPDVKIIDNNHKFSKQEGVSTTEHSYGEIFIGESSWIGANAVLLKNANIGKRCVIGAGCVINQEIPDNSIVTLHKNNIVIDKIREKN